MRRSELFISRITRRVKIIKRQPILIPEQIQNGRLERGGLIPMIRSAIRISPFKTPR